MSIRQFAIMSLVFFLGCGGLAQGQSPCGPDGQGMIAMLQKDYGEEVKALGMTPNGNLVQWLANDQTGTWSMVVIMPNGVGCLIHSGDHWYVVPPVTEGAVS